MGGLGLGGWFWGKRLDAHASPLFVYGVLELAIAAFAGLSPFLLSVVQGAYASLGGPLVFGAYSGVGVRLLLAMLVMGVPVFCMGGTLPAMARFVTHATDTRRQGLATLYGVNTLGSVVGALLGTFYLFEQVGIKNALWFAAVFNGAIALSAMWLSAKLPQTTVDNTAELPTDTSTGVTLSRSLTLMAAFVAGFVFFVAEMVWFRMSAPILGGTTYSFGLVLAWALVGIGLGAIVYRKINPKRITPALLVFTFLLEGVTLLLPFAMGDSLALWAHHARMWAGYDFLSLCLGWSLVSCVLVLPPALVAGFQFPVVVALRGQGPNGVAGDVGSLYLSNTTGAVVGALAGGFGLMPLFGALGVWQLCAGIVAATGVFICMFLPQSQRPTWGPIAFVLVITVGAMVFPTGPTAVWRHSGIGASRSFLLTDNPNDLQASLNSHRRNIRVELEGVESPIGILHEGLSLLNSGKSDGNAWKDAMTTVMLGLTGAMLHPEPEHAFVVGLGAGQTAGWLAQVPSMKRVDVVELEPEVADFARMAEKSNFNVMEHPKVNLMFEDGRALLMASKQRYDIIVSEPSNPYRAGVASFFTADFYGKVKERLKDQGYFAQWVQGYEIDLPTLHLILASLKSHFSHVSVWSLMSLDYVILASNHPQVYDVDLMNRNLAIEPFKTALNDLGGIFDVEGFLTLHEANPQFVTLQTAPPNDVINTDDQNLLEYRFAKSMGSEQRIYPKILYGMAQDKSLHRPQVKGQVDWDKVARLKNRVNQFYDVKLAFSHERDWWALVKEKKYQQAVTWLRQSTPAAAHDVFERVHRFEFVLYFGRQMTQREPEDSLFHPDIDPWLSPQGQQAFIANLQKTGRVHDANWLRFAQAVLGPDDGRVLKVAVPALASLRETPWVRRSMVERVFQQLLARNWQPESARDMARLLAQAPFALNAHDNFRMTLAQHLAQAGEDWELCAALYNSEAHAPKWEGIHLQRRLLCYEKTQHPNLVQARTDWDLFAQQR